MDTQKLVVLLATVSEHMHAYHYPLIETGAKVGL